MELLFTGTSLKGYNCSVTYFHMRVYDLPSRTTGNTCGQSAACLNFAGLGSFASLWSKLAVNSERHVDLEPEEIPAGGQQCPFLVNSSLNNLPSNEAKYVLT